MVLLRPVIGGGRLDYGLTITVTLLLALIGEAHLKSERQISAPSGSLVVPPDAARCAALSDDTDSRGNGHRYPRIHVHTAAWNR